MSDINSVVVVGRVVEKPVLKYAASGTAVANLRIANNTYQGKGKDEKVNWLNITVFSKRAECCEKYLEKGSQVAIEGRLDWSSWIAKDGQKRSAIKVIANSVQFIGGKRKNTNSDTQPQQQETKQPDPDPNNHTAPAEEQGNIEFTNSKSEFESPIDDSDDIPF